MLDAFDTAIDGILLSNLLCMISKFFLASTGIRTAGQITGQVLTSPFPTKRELASHEKEDEN